MATFIGLIWNPLLLSGITYSNGCLDSLSELQENRFVRPATLEDLIKDPLIGCPLIGCSSPNEKEAQEIRKRVRDKVLWLLEREHSAESSPSFATIHGNEEYLVNFQGSWDMFPLMRSQRTLVEWANYVHHHRMVDIIKQQFSLYDPARTDNTWMYEKGLVESTFGSYKNLIEKLKAAEVERLAKIKIEYFSVMELLTVPF